MQLDEIIAIGGRPGLYKVAMQTRTGVVAVSLVDGKKNYGRSPESGESAV